MNDGETAAGLRPLRRRGLIVGGSACAAWSALPWIGNAGAATTRDAPALAAPQPMAQLLVGNGGALLAVSRSGELWQYAAPAWRRLGAGLDPATPMASGHGRSVGRSADGGLWVLESGRQNISPGPDLAPHAGLMVLALGVIAVARGSAGQHHAVRLEPGAASRWAETARSAEAVLPDARPLQFDPAGRESDDNGHVIVLAGPDNERYRHAVLGDDVEASAVLFLERHSLRPIARLDLPAPYVFEDIAPRALAWRDGRGLLTARSGPLGAQLAVVAMGGDGKLTLAALGEPIGTRHRWLSPVTDGTRLLALHTPHIGGLLHRYRAEGERLVGEMRARGITNHVLGRRELDIGAWVGHHYVVPSQDRRTLQVLDPDTGDPGVTIAALPAPAAILRAWKREGAAGVAVLLDDGAVLWSAVAP